jgi:hypothetical protein
VRFTPNPAGIVDLMTDPGMKLLVVGATAAVRDEAEAGSPRRTGHFATSFTTEVETTATGPVGTLGNSDVGAAAIEFGSVNNPPYAPIRRAVRATGLRLQDSRG